MASIPIYTAEGRSISPGTPSHITVPSTGLEHIGATSASLANTLAEHGAKLQDQKDQTDFLMMKSQYDAILKNHEADLQMDPEIYSHPDAYVTKFSQLSRDSIDQLSATEGVSPFAKRLFTSYVAVHFPTQLVAAKAAGRVLFAKNEVKNLDNLKEIMSDDAVNAETPADKKQIVDEFTTNVIRAQANRLLTPADAFDRIYDFGQRVADKAGRKLVSGTEAQREQWRELVRTGKTGIKDTDIIQKISDMARIKEEHEERKTKQNMAEVNRIMMGYSFGLAMYGNLSDSFIEDVAQMKVPGITPQEGLRLKEVNDSAPISGATLEVRNIITEMATRPGRPTEQRVEEAKAKLRDIMLKNGKSGKEIEVQSKALESLSLHLRSVQAAELQSGIAYGKQVLEAGRGTGGMRLIPGIPAHQETNKFNQMMAEYNVWIMRNPNVTKEDMDKKIIELRNRIMGNPTAPKSEKAKTQEMLLRTRTR